MSARTRSPLAAVLTLSLLVSSCVTTQLPPISSSGAGFAPEEDELKIWDRARAEEGQFLGEAPLYDDPLLHEYLAGVVARLTPPAMAANQQVVYEVRVVEDPILSAFSYPHGSIYLNTGLLARMENESQLATVLGHEMTHIENRHAVRQQRIDRNRRNREIGFGLGTLAALILLEEAQDDAIRDDDYDKWLLAGVGQVLVGVGAELALQASVSGFAGDFEREADFGSFAKMETAGYDLAEPPRLYEQLQYGRVEHGELETFFFGSIPRLSERINHAKEHLARQPQASEGPEPTSSGPLTFEQRIGPVLRDNARLNIDLDRLQLASSELERALALMPEDAEVHLLVGQLKLAQADERRYWDSEDAARLTQEAAESLHESLRLAPERPDAHRELGMIAYRADSPAAACTELAAYLELAPDAVDSQMVRGYVQNLDRIWHCVSW